MWNRIIDMYFDADLKPNHLCNILRTTSFLHLVGFWNSFCFDKCFKDFDKFYDMLIVFHNLNTDYLYYYNIFAMGFRFHLTRWISPLFQVAVSVPWTNDRYWHICCHGDCVNVTVRGTVLPTPRHLKHLNPAFVKYNAMQVSMIK